MGVREASLQGDGEKDVRREGRAVGGGRGLTGLPTGLMGRGGVRATAMPSGAVRAARPACPLLVPCSPARCFPLSLARVAHPVWSLSESPSSDTWPDRKQVRNRPNDKNCQGQPLGARIRTGKAGCARKLGSGAHRAHDWKRCLCTSLCDSYVALVNDAGTVEPADVDVR